MESKLTKSIIFLILISSVLAGCTDKSQSDKTQNKNSSQRIHREEPDVSIYDLEKEAHSLSRSWYRVNVTGKFSGNCEGISGNPSEDVYSHYKGHQSLKYANKSKDGKEFSLGYQVGGMGGEESFYRYTTTNQWCENILAAIIGK